MPVHELCHQLVLQCVHGKAVRRMLQKLPSHRVVGGAEHLQSLEHLQSIVEIAIRYAWRTEKGNRQRDHIPLRQVGDERRTVPMERRLSLSMATRSAQLRYVQEDYRISTRAVVQNQDLVRLPVVKVALVRHLCDEIVGVKLSQGPLARVAGLAIDADRAKFLSISLADCNIVPTKSRTSAKW